MKRIFKIKNIVYLFLISFLIVGCSKPLDEASVISASVVADTVPEEINIGEFNKAGIKAIVNYSNGTSKVIDINSNFLSENEKKKLETPGSYELEILINEKPVKFKVNIIEPIDAPSLYQVRFFNEKKEIISYQLVKEGKAALEPDFESYKKEGYDFIGWDKKIDNISADIDVYPLYQKSKDSNAISNKFLKGRIYKEKSIIETEHFKVELDANVYVPPYFEEYLEIIYDTLETVSGLKFYNQHYNSGKIVIEVEKPNVADNKDAEQKGAYAYSIGSRIHISSGDLLLGNSYALTHELSHILQYSQSSWHYNSIYGEGFAQYNSYKATRYLEKKNIYVAKSIEDSYSHISDMSIQGNIYAKTMEYWIANNKEAYNISGNGPYSIGFRFMKYLDDVYSDYSKWIHHYEKERPYHTIEIGVDQEVVMSKQIEVMKKTYGENVLDNFYLWLKSNSDFFDSPWNNDHFIYDISSLKYAYIYPSFNYGPVEAKLVKFNIVVYEDLYISIDEVVNYYKNYKGKNVDKLKLTLDSEVNVELYNSNDELLLAKKGKEFSLAGVSYIKLVGKGQLGEYRGKGLKITLE